MLVVLGVAVSGHAPAASPQADESAAGKAVYDGIRAFGLTGGVAEVAGLSLVRDRVEMTFTGTFYFAAPVNGRVTGAVFMGQGMMKAAVPPVEFEREHVRRMLGADAVDSDFRTAVLRWSDDTFDVIGKAKTDGASTPQAQRLAADGETRFTTETGANLSARLAASILNNETPGVFVGQFDGGRRDRFTVLLDHQNRIPLANFRLNGGEKGVIYSYQSALYANDVWMAFYSTDDYARRAAVYSDTNDLVDVSHYRLDLDVRDLDSKMGLVARMDLQSRVAGVRAVPFNIGESLSGYQSARLRNQLRMKKARQGDRELAWVQEDWEGGFTVFLPSAVPAGERLTIEVELEGDFIRGVDVVPECFYPFSNETWFPRHGYLDRATFDTTFRHRRRDRIASIGVRLSEAPDPDDKDAFITRYRMAQPVALSVFAIGPFERKTQSIQWDNGDPPIPLEFNSVPSRVFPIKEDFILAELDNSVRYFKAMFGKYPYEGFGAAFHPYGFGQGFPSMLMIPPTDRAEKYTYAFIAHETAHQWWGNIVAWRSYRDQWLSEGFAEYSGLLYTGKRDKNGARSTAEMIKELRDSLRDPPRTSVGVARGRLNDIGPIIQGHRLNSSKSYGAYQALIYNKGALVLRMLHFLLSHPTTGDDSAFTAMMTDFVEKYRNGAASTDNFREVANAHFARSPMAQRYGLPHLDWFFQQWIYRTDLPSYQLDYAFKDQPDGSVIITGTVKQENVPEDFFMPLPIVFSFDGNREARTTVKALGPSTPFELKLPGRPRRVELDPHSWVLSERTTTRAR